MTWWESFKHAFALGDNHPELNAEEVRVLRVVLLEIKKRQLVTPALIFLEMSRPLTGLSAQLMHYFQPIVSTFLDISDYRIFAGILERTDAANLLIKGLEEVQKET